MRLPSEFDIRVVTVLARPNSKSAMPIPVLALPFPVALWFLVNHPLKTQFPEGVCLAVSLPW